MRSSKPPSEFFAAMKKKPPLQKILDSLNEYSDDDLDNVSQALWIRTELKRLKNATPSKVFTDEEIDEIFPVNQPIDTTGEVFRWTAQDTFIKTSGFEYLFKDGDVFWVQSPPTVLWGSTVVILKNWNDFLANTISQGIKLRSDFLNDR